MFLSLGSTDIRFTINNTEITITDIGDDNGNGSPPLICHTDLVTCCSRNSETMTRGMGHWYYPDGARILGGIGSAITLPFVTWRNVQEVRLARRESNNPPPLRPTGSYCCTIPTTEGEMVFCAKLGE